jgi:hypothetical protein
MKIFLVLILYLIILINYLTCFLVLFMFKFIFLKYYNLKLIIKLMKIKILKTYFIILFHEKNYNTFHYLINYDL